MLSGSIFVSLILLLCSVPIFLVFGIGSSSAAILGLNLPWSTLIQVSFAALTKHVLTAVPLFIFAGMVMLRGGAATRLVSFSTALVGHWPGGLGIAMVIAMGFFAAFCGSILAAITAVGTIMMPKMIEQGYPKPFVIVLAASAALLEALIPPSNAAILFSVLTNVPVSMTFAAGVIPGCILLGLMVLVVLFKCRDIRNSLPATGAEKWTAFRQAMPTLMTPLIILGGIYAGILTPSESAAVAGIWAIIMGFVIYRELTFTSLLQSLRETATITAVIFAIIATATFLSVVLTYTQAPQASSLFHRYGNQSDAVLDCPCGDLFDPWYLYRDCAGLLSDGADIRGNQSVLQPEPAASVCGVCGLCGYRHDHTASLCRYLYQC